MNFSSFEIAVCVENANHPFVYYFPEVTNRAVYRNKAKTGLQYPVFVMYD